MTKYSLGIKERFRTRDLYEAATLYSLEIPLLTLEKEGRQFWFVFDDLEECKSLSNKYWEGKLEVSAKKYADAIRTLKDRIFSQKEEN